MEHCDCCGNRNPILHIFQVKDKAIWICPDCVDHADLDFEALAEYIRQYGRQA